MKDKLFNKKDIINNYNKFDYKKNIQLDKLCNKNFEKILNELYPILNKIHKINWGKRSWRVLIGPWLHRYICILTNRYFILKKIKKNNNSFFNKLILRNSIIPLSKNLNHFTDLSMQDNYNYKLLSLLSKKIKNKKIDIKIEDKLKSKNKICEIRNKIFGFLLKILNILLCGKKNIFLYKTYFGNFKVILHLILKLKQFPILYPSFLEKGFSNEKISMEKRNKLKNLKSKNEIEKILNELIYIFIPKFYLEDFNNNLLSAKKIYPNKANVVLTAVGIWKDTLFKIWLSEKLNNKTKLICRQHGGNYGQNELIFEEKHEIKVSDYFFSWGWVNKNKKVLPCFGIIEPKLRKFEKKFKKILLVTQTPHKFLYFDNGTMDNYKSKNYINFLDVFFEKIQHKIKNKIYLRFKNLNSNSPKKKIDVHFKNLLTKKYKNLHISNIKNFYQDIENKKLVIFTYNGTAFLNSLKANVPSIILFNKNYIYLKKSSKKIYFEMKKNHIFFDDPIRASNFINQNLNNIDEWWESKKVRNTISNYLDLYNKKYNGLNDKFFYHLKKII